MKVLLLGASGLVGHEVLRLLVAKPQVERVLVLARKADTAPAKVEWRKVDFDAEQTYARLAEDEIDAVASCLGTTMKQAGSKAAFHRVDVEYPLRVAQALAPYAAELRFSLVSSVGANPRSSAYYLRAKGELERGLEALGFAHLALLRPSFLLGERPRHRMLEALLAPPFRAAGALMRGPLEKYRPIDATSVATALVETLLDPPPEAVFVLHRAEMLNMQRNLLH